MADKKPKPTRLEDVEITPEAWERFESAVDSAVKNPASSQSRKKTGQTPAPERTAGEDDA